MTEDYLENARVRVWCVICMDQVQIRSLTWKSWKT